MVVPTRAPDNLWIAAGDGQLERVKQLIESGVDPNSKDENGYTAIHAAVSYDQKPVLEYLLSKGGDVNIEDSDKDTPLFVAETVPMAQFLLDHGADPYHCNSEGVSAARNALEEGWKDVAELLASITKEELPSLDDRIEETMANETIDATTSESELEGYVQAMMQRIQDEGGVQDEEELREVVTKIILEQLRRSVEQ